jgi:hypothetical protein
VAIRALARLQDERIMPALKAAAETEGNRDHLEQELLGLLMHDSGDTMADYVASAVSHQESTLDQEWIVRFLSLAEIPRQTKMRICSHYAQFKEYGKHAIIRALQDLDDADAFAQLCRVLRSRDEAFRTAAYALGQLKNSDPCPVLLKELSKMDNGPVDCLILVLGEKCYAPAIGEFRRWQAIAERDPDRATTRLLTAAALCGLDVDYDRNATVVREGLKDDRLRWSAATVAGWLHDEETVQALISVLDRPDLHDAAVEALGRIGSRSGAPALMRAAETLPMERFRAIGDALLAIGRKNEDQAATDFGQGLSDVATSVPWLLSFHQQASPGNPFLAEWERAAPCLTSHPQVTANIIRHVQHGEIPMHAIGLSFLNRVWNPELVPVVEELIRTDEFRTNRHTDHGVFPHFSRRSAFAEFLTRKTGKEYTYVDVDGTVRKGGEGPE